LLAAGFALVHAWFANPAKKRRRVRVVNTKYFSSRPVTKKVVLIDRWDNRVDPAKKRRRNERFSALIIITAYAVQALMPGRQATSGLHKPSLGGENSS
jgi:hypothetical protein